MKTITPRALYKIICLLVLAFMTANAQAKKTKAAESESSATLAETLAFIDQKLAMASGNGLKFELINNGSCNGIIYKQHLSNEKTEFMTISDEFSLSDMDPDRIVYSGAKLTLHTYGDRKRIIESLFTDTLGLISRTEKSDVWLEFNPEMIERVAKAFKHAIKLCTGGYKKELF